MLSSAFKKWLYQYKISIDTLVQASLTALTFHSVRNKTKFLLRNDMFWAVEENKEKDKQFCVDITNLNCICVLCFMNHESPSRNNIFTVTCRPLDVLIITQQSQSIGQYEAQSWQTWTKRRRLATVHATTSFFLFKSDVLQYICKQKMHYL